MVKEFAQHFHVSESAISRLRTKYRQTGTIKDRPRPGRPRKTTRRKDSFIVTSSRRNCFLSSTRIAGLQEHGYVLRLLETDFERHGYVGVVHTLVFL